MKLLNNFVSVKCTLSNILLGRVWNGECVDIDGDNFRNNGRGKRYEEKGANIYSKVFSDETPKLNIFL